MPKTILVAVTIPDAEWRTFFALPAGERLNYLTAKVGEQVGAAADAAAVDAAPKGKVLL